MNPEIITQLEGLMDRALLVDAPGDECAMFLRGQTTFLTGDNTPNTITMVVPLEADFYGQCLNLFLGSRLYDQADPVGPLTDQAFRPASWVSINNAKDPNGRYEVQDASCAWSLSDTYNGTYQGPSPINISSIYSGQYGQGSVYSQVNLSAWVSGRQFFVPRKVKRGNTISITVQPTFSRVQNATIKTQFRVLGVFTGYKVVRSLS